MKTSAQYSKEKSENAWRYWFNIWAQTDNDHTFLSFCENSWDLKRSKYGLETLWTISRICLTGTVFLLHLRCLYSWRYDKRQEPWKILPKQNRTEQNRNIWNIPTLYFELQFHKTIRMNQIEKKWQKSISKRFKTKKRRILNKIRIKSQNILPSKTSNRHSKYQNSGHNPNQMHS